MRNLALLATTIAKLDGVSSVAPRITATAIDLDEKVLYLASERSNSDEDSGEVEVEIYKLKDDNLTSEALFTTTAYKWGDKKSAVEPPKEIVDLHVLPETRKLGLFLRGGDIAMMDLDSEEPMIEVEGTVEPGILAASWNPDESALAIVTGEEKLLLMTSSFDTLSEKPITTSEFGQDAPINVGWGSKQTQFHGSLGKAAAQAPTTTIVGASPDDDGLPRISWRGDGAFFVASLFSHENGLNRRTLRVYDREGALQSTAEAVPGLEGVLSWRPSGNLIAGTQRFGGFEGAGVGREGRHDVVFFERNGLRHGEFGLWVGRDAKDGASQDGSSSRKWGYRVKELLWSPDSNVLAVWIEHDEGDAVQLWTTGNYHWYLKQEVWAPTEKEGAPGRFTSVSWHPETATHLILTTYRSVIQRTYIWKTFSSPSAPPKDSGSVAVFDGSQILLTPFRTQNVPPPMSSAQLPLFIPLGDEEKKYGKARPWRMPIHSAFSNLDELLVVLWESGEFAVFDLETRLGPGPGKVMNPQWKWGGNLWEVLSAEGDEVFLPRQVVVLDGWTDGWQQDVVILGMGKEGDVVLVVAPDDKIDMFRKPGEEKKNLQLKSRGNAPGRNGRLVQANAGVIAWQGSSGELFEFDSMSEQFLPASKFPEFSYQAQRVLLDQDDAAIYIGLSSRNKLHISFEDSWRTVSTNATSFTIASGFLIYTTSAHESIYAPLPSLLKLLTSSDDDDPQQEKMKAAVVPEDEGWEKRRVERGSRIVVAVPSSMALVLQMPRGNLETINPRPLVMEVVKQDLDRGNYRKAFFACRKHRIDLNVLVNHNEAKFLKSVKEVVEQIHEVDHINLLLTNIGRGSYTPEKIATLCDAIRGELERVNLVKYINSILTAYVVKSPPDHESALNVLHRLRETDPNVVEDAVKYIIFLADADKLFDVALGMYDFSLVLLIAQFAQKDPREYLPFLRELRALEKYYQRFRIDDHLKRYESALRNLSLAGDERLEDAFAYVEKHQLFESALRLWKGTPHHSKVLELYGDWLFERRDFRQAAVAFIEAKRPPKALIAHEKALEWQELFDLAAELQTSAEDVDAMAYRVADDLISKKRYTEAATVFLDYAKNVRQAIIALVDGNAFSEARRIVRLHSVPELVEEIIHPAALESRSQISEELKEMQDQLRKQRNRLKELRIRKIEEPDAFYNTEDPTLHNVDVMTDVSMAPTTFTRYTVAPSTASRTSKRSSRSKRKLERKVGSGRKGTVDEEEYLLKSVTKLVGRFSITRDLAKNLLPHLFQFTEEHREEGLELQMQISEFEKELQEALDEIWFRPEEDGETWASRMEEIERKKQVNPVDRVTKPDFLAGKDWKIDLYNLS
ncbi:hypothetical protein AX16_001304 [Volvariella volvacea WC 439]|nr:hypothetical protein AX16_001304 [Volvariella volvacea WC 439]